MPKKLENIDLKNKQNQNDIDNVNKIYIKLNAENFDKKIIEIPILIKYEV
jgi:hypothetical protein